MESTVAAEWVNHSKTIYRVEPITDPRWSELLERHPRASVFHSPAWLQSLDRTYGYKCFALTTSPVGAALHNGLVFCCVESWLTGRRLVSLPFSDHCEPLVDGEEDLLGFAAALEEECRREQWRYIEIRPLKCLKIETSLAHTPLTYSFHQLDLEPDLDTIFGRFHKSSVQRKIRRAEREGLIYQEGSTESLLDSFYRLLKLTRQRHKLPAQPRTWFLNLMNCFGEALKIRIALKGDRPVAGMLTLRYKDTLVYKYGCSDSRFSNLGGTHLLFWNAIQEAKKSGLRVFDFGRTDAGQTGLIVFKNRWGATQSLLTYSRYATGRNSTHVFDLPSAKWKLKAAKQVLANLHPRVLSMLGDVLYKHIG